MADGLAEMTVGGAEFSPESTERVLETVDLIAGVETSSSGNRRRRAAITKEVQEKTLQQVCN